MRVFVSEYICSGSSNNGPLDDSLATEGRSMLLAACADFARISGVEVVTTWDVRLGPFPLANVRAVVISDPDYELREFERQVAECDAAFVIAPEFRQILAGRIARITEPKRRAISPSVDAVELCADKQRIYEHLTQHRLPTIETAILPRDRVVSEQQFPVVIKPRDGAGSQNTFVVGNRGEFERVAHVFSNGNHDSEPIVQPYWAGRSMSVGVLIDPGTNHIEVLPPAEQFLSDDGRLRYLGGRIQGAGSLRWEHLVSIQRACRSIPGLAGYVGFDMLFPFDESQQMVIVEINPRLTTSYLGYRVLTEENLMERLLFPERFPLRVRWADRATRFTPDGKITFEGC